jgi:hypothetical protein
MTSAPLPSPARVVLTDEHPDTPMRLRVYGADGATASSELGVAPYTAGRDRRMRGPYRARAAAGFATSAAYALPHYKPSRAFSS